LLAAVAITNPTGALYLNHRQLVHECGEWTSYVRTITSGWRRSR
jgi:hypothetical protein